METFETKIIGDVVAQVHPDDSCDHDSPLLDQFDQDDTIKVCTFERNSTETGQHPFDEPNEAVTWAAENGHEVIGLFKYEHGSVAYRAAFGENPFHCPWDSGQVGVVLVNEKHRRTYDDRPVLEAVNALLDTWSSWCNGTMYGWSVAPSDDADEHLDSCWGYYSVEEAMGEAVNAAQHIAADREVEQKQVRETEMMEAAHLIEASRPDMYSNLTA